MVLSSHINLKWCQLHLSGAYPDVTSEEADAASDTYCPSMPFYWAFITLICVWIFMPLICCCQCCHMCYKVQKMKSEVENIAWRDLPCACVPFAQMTIIQCISFYKENRHEEKSFKMFTIISVKHTHKIKMLVPTLNVNIVPLMTNKDLTLCIIETVERQNRYFVMRPTQVRTDRGIARKILRWMKLSQSIRAILALARHGEPRRPGRAAEKIGRPQEAHAGRVRGSPEKARSHGVLERQLN